MAKRRSFQIAQYIVIVLGFVLCVVITGVRAPLAYADSPQQISCQGAGGTWDHPPLSSDPTKQDTSKPKQCNNTSTNGPTFQHVITVAINLLLFAVGVIAVIVIVISAVRFVNSGGDTQQVSKAKDAIIYALVSIVVATSAFVIVNFVLAQL
jgi:hypothetical protein